MAKIPSGEAPAGTAVSSDDALAKMLSMLVDLTGRFDAVEARLARVEERPAPVNSGDGGDAIIQPKPDLRGMKAGDSREGGKTLYRVIDSTGVIRQFKPRFKIGDTVRLNPEGPTATILAKDPQHWDVNNLVGRVVGFHYIRKNMVPKHRVAFPGLTRGKMGDGFDETELLPA